MDHVTKGKRSKIMAAIHSKNTSPEILVRKLVYALGYRYRLHGKDLPGKPDLVFKSKKKVIFVNGCFWHGHKGCEKARLPKTRIDFWQKKIDDNIKRDESVRHKLAITGWQHLTIWQCEIKKHEVIEKQIINFLIN